MGEGKKLCKAKKKNLGYYYRLYAVVDSSNSTPLPGCTGTAEPGGTGLFPQREEAAAAVSTRWTHCRPAGVEGGKAAMALPEPLKAA